MHFIETYDVPPFLNRKYSIKYAKMVVSAKAALLTPKHFSSHRKKEQLQNTDNNFLFSYICSKDLYINQ